MGRGGRISPPREGDAGVVVREDRGWRLDNSGIGVIAMRENVGWRLGHVIRDIDRGMRVNGGWSLGDLGTGVVSREDVGWWSREYWGGSPGYGGG